MKKNPVVHFEMPAKDKKRVKKFYENTFGWEMNLMDEDYGGYLLATTSPMTKDMMHKEKGAINGGFYESKKNDPPHVVISVDTLKSAMARIKKNGGKLIGKPMDIPNIGGFILFKDSEGNKVGMLEPSKP